MISTTAVCLCCAILRVFMVLVPLCSCFILLLLDYTGDKRPSTGTTTTRSRIAPAEAFTITTTLPLPPTARKRRSATTAAADSFYYCRCTVHSSNSNQENKKTSTTSTADGDNGDIYDNKKEQQQFKRVDGGAGAGAKTVIPNDANGHDHANNNSEEYVYYFSIGSMCNPMGMSNRNISQPIESNPAMILNHTLHFFGLSGFAGAVPITTNSITKDATVNTTTKPTPNNKSESELELELESSLLFTSSFHGVVHTITKHDKRKLDNIEFAYDTQLCTVQLYNGTVLHNNVEVYVYNRTRVKEIFRIQNQIDCLPTERYMSIIIEGCNYYGVQQSYIHYLESLPYIPRKDSRLFTTLLDNYDDDDISSSSNTTTTNNNNNSTRTTILPMMTMEDVIVNGTGRNGQPLYTTCNGKVLRHDGFGTEFTTRIQYSKEVLKVHSYEIITNTAQYDPIFGSNMKSQRDVTKFCAASIEDQIVTWQKKFTKAKMTTKTTVVGYIDLPYKD